MYYEKVKTLLLHLIEEINGFPETEYKIEPTLDEILVGEQSALDSLGFVQFIIFIEQKIEEEFGVQISIVDEKAFAQKNNPFKTVGSLLEFIVSRLEDVNNRY
jgi:acyl carrier protein